MQTAAVPQTKDQDFKKSLFLRPSRKFKQISQVKQKSVVD